MGWVTYISDEGMRKLFGKGLHFSHQALAPKLFNMICETEAVVIAFGAKTELYKRKQNMYCMKRFSVTKIDHIRALS